jgi:hypothetical protein
MQRVREQHKQKNRWFNVYINKSGCITRYPKKGYYRDGADYIKKFNELNNLKG